MWCLNKVLLSIEPFKMVPKNRLSKGCKVPITHELPGALPPNPHQGAYLDPRPLGREFRSLHFAIKCPTFQFSNVGRYGLNSQSDCFFYVMLGSEYVMVVFTLAARC